MPIDYYINHSRRLVIARGSGTFTESDVLGYQREVWSRPDVAGYHELVDMSDVREIALPASASSSLHQLATEAAAMDQPGTASKLAIVAPERLAFGLGRMYQAYRELDPRSTKQVGVFRTLIEAMSFLGIETLEDPGASPNPAAAQDRIR